MRESDITKYMIDVYFDGVCEPINPGGVAGYGYIVFKNQHEIYKASKLFRPTPGKKDTSNNIAEYSAFLDAMKWLVDNKLNNEEVNFHGDSKLVIEQMFGTWKMNSGLYIPYALEAKEMMKKFSHINGEWIPRESNNQADKLSKAELIKAGVEFRIQPL